MLKQCEGHKGSWNEARSEIWKGPLTGFVGCSKMHEFDQLYPRLAEFGVLICYSPFTPFFSALLS